MTQNQKINSIFLYTTIHKYECVIELTGISSYNELVSNIIKLLGIPDSHNFSEGYSIQLLEFGATFGSTGSKSTIILDRNFFKIKDKSKIKVIEKITLEESTLPVDYERPHEYIGIHLKHASFTTQGKLPNVYVSFLFKKKPLRQASSSIKANNLLPVWNENFMLPLLLENDMGMLTNEKIQDSLIVKVVNTNEEKASDHLNSSRSGKSEKSEKDDIKEIFLSKFEVQLSHLKKRRTNDV